MRSDKEKRNPAVRGSFLFSFACGKALGGGDEAVVFAADEDGLPVLGRAGVIDVFEIDAVVKCHLADLGDLPTERVGAALP